VGAVAAEEQEAAVEVEVEVEVKVKTLLRLLASALNSLRRWQTGRVQSAERSTNVAMPA
jgi:hypothetical protein